MVLRMLLFVDKQPPWNINLVEQLFLNACIYAEHIAYLFLSFYFHYA